MRSGLDVPELGEGPGVTGDKREGLVGCELVVGDWGFEVPIVVVRCMFVVSADGGGGRFRMMKEGERIEARQRKHSPVPK